MNVLCVLSLAGAIGFTMAAVVTDFCSMRISNRLILAGLAVSLALRIGQGGLTVILPYLGNIAFPVVTLYLFYLIGMIGAGDIKLFSLVGGFVNFTTLINCMVMAFLTGAAFSLVKLLVHPGGGERLGQGFFYLFSLLCGNREPYPRDTVSRDSLIHFALCILIGLLASVFSPIILNI